MTNTDPLADYRLDGCLQETAEVPSPELTRVAARALPTRVDLRRYCSPVEDQGRIGSCTANAVAGALEYDQLRAGRPLVDLSRLFLYYNSRHIRGDITVDSGCTIRQAVASVVAFGACPEEMWPYAKAIWSERPSQECFRAARRLPGLQYACISPRDLRATLAAGLPIVFGMAVARPLFGTARESGRIDVPGGEWPEAAGGHAMLLVGYDDSERSYLVRNSWGPRWGDGGHARIAYEVLEYYTVGRVLNYWAIGDLSSADGFALGGVTVEESQRRMLDGTLHPFPELRPALEANLERAKRGFRDRLRGPGAGGGY